MWLCGRAGGVTDGLYLFMAGKSCVFTLQRLRINNKDSIVRFTLKPCTVLTKELKKLRVASPKPKVQQRINSKIKEKTGCGASKSHFASKKW